MEAQNTQLRVTIPVQLQAYLQTKADKFGLSLSAYVKNLIINDVKDIEYPIYTASDFTENAYKEARIAEKEGKLVEVGNIEDFLANL